MPLPAYINRILYMYPALLFAITLHEYFHALAAHSSGDPIPSSQGRLTLNPAAHSDTLGTVIFPLIGLMMGGIIFGWGKPVVTNPAFYRNPRRDNIFVSFAGPAANLLILTAVAIIVRVLILNDYYNPVIFTLLACFVFLNTLLFMFNLIPIPPLDGHHIVENLFPQTKPFYFQLKMMGPFVLIMLFIILMYSGVFRFIIGLPMDVVLESVFSGVDPEFWDTFERTLWK